MNYYQKCMVKGIWALGLLALMYTPVQAQLSGKYTIDPTQTASSTNYRTWSSAISDMRSGTRSDGGTAQGSGISGPVEFTVYDTVYKEQLYIQAITGASYTNTITFTSKGGDSTKCVLEVASGTLAGSDYVVGMSGVQYMTFHKIGMERTGNNRYATVVELSGGCDKVTLSHCWLKGRKSPSTSGIGFQSGIGSCVHITGNSDSTQIINNTMLYGYNGVYGTVSCTANRIIGNQIDTSGSSGVYITNQTDLQVTGNTFNMGDFGPSTGHYTSYGCRIESSPGMLVNKNKIYMTATNGQVVRAIILANTTSTKANPTQVNNNWIMNAGGTGSCTGLAVYNCRWVDFYYNNILVTNSLKDGSSYYHYDNFTNSNINLVNNNLINTGGGYVYNVPGTNTGDLAKVDYNNCYATGSKFGKWGGTDYNTFASWKTNANNDTNSVSVSPGFNSIRDHHVSNISLNGKATPYSLVTDDIDGDTRSTTSPDIGADEFFPVNLDAGIAKVDSPAAFCAGSQDVKVTFQNYGVDTLKSLSINWSVNGISQTGSSWTGVVAPGQSSASIKLGSYTFSANTQYTFKVWTSSPNGKSDGKTVNDTLSISRKAGLSGTYSLGLSTGNDYRSFNDAITDMTARGVCGPVTFNVADGIYQEQLTLVQLDGMGATAPITFQSVSKDSSKVEITLPSTTATGTNNAAVQLNGADYVTFKGITFRRTGNNNFAQVVHILNQSNNNTFENCQLIGTVATGVNADGVNIWSTIGQDNNNVFRNNRVVYGSYSMQYYGPTNNHESGTIIEGNTFDSAYNSALLIGYNDGVIVRNNEFNNVISPATGNFDVQLLDCDSNVRVSKNIFYDRNSEYGLFYEDCDASRGNPAFTDNNFIDKKEGIGIYINGAEHHQVVFNSIRVRGATNTNAAVSTGTNRSRNISLLNNNVAMNAGFAFSIEDKDHISESNHNNLYVQGSRFMYWNGNNYNTFGNYKKNSGQDSASLNVNPAFTARFDLHTSNSSLNAAGIAVAGITTDYDGDLRSSTPDIGADEFDPGLNDAGILAITSPSLNSCAGVVDVKAVIKNFGTDDLTSVSLGWAVNGTAQTTYNWSGTLKSQETDTVTLGSFTFAGNTTPAVLVYSSSPNTQSDSYSGNDSTSAARTINPLPPNRGGADKDMCQGDSVSIGLVNQTAYTYSWTEAGATTEFSTDSRVFVKPSTSTTYYLEITRTTTGCVAIDTVDVKVNVLPAKTAGGNQVICEGAGAILGSTALNNHLYEWTSMPAGFTSNSASPLVVPGVSTTYYLKQTIDSTGCYTLDTAVITVNETPSSLVNGNGILCKDETNTYGTPLNNGNTYTWTVDGGSIFSGAGTNSVDITWSRVGTGSVRLIETNADNCSDTSIVPVEVVANPAANFSVLGNCVFRDIAFEDLSDSTDTRVWNFGDGATSTRKKPTHQYSTSGSYYIKLVATNEGLCKDSFVRQIKVSDAPVILFDTDDPLCEKQDITFDATVANATSTYWYFGDGNSSPTNQNSIVHQYDAAGSYGVKVVGDNEGCKDSTSKSFDIKEAPDASFSISVDGRDVTVSATNKDEDSYDWDFGDGTVAEGTEAKHSYSITEGWVFVDLTVTNSEGCSFTKTDSIFVDLIGIEELPKGLRSVSVYPNPFNEQVRIELDLEKSSDVFISLLDITGAETGFQYEAQQASGKVQVDVQASKLGLRPGMYLARIVLDDSTVIYQNLEMY